MARTTLLEPDALPTCAGIGLRAPHHAEFRERWPAAGWVEVHSENYMADGGPAPGFLATVRARYPVSLHGVGLSLGSPRTPATDRHLERLARLVERIEPAAVSEHLCWSAAGSHHYNDLLPLPYTEEALDLVAARVEQAQQRLGRALLVENLSSYVRFAHETIPEWEFLAALAARTGCGLLLDVNNVYVSAVNHGFDAQGYIAALPASAIGEIHLAGHDEHDGLLVDTHGRRVQAAVWDLYAHALTVVGPRPTLIEWDTDIPALDVLLDEAAHAGRLLEQGRARAA